MIPKNQSRECAISFSPRRRSLEAQHTKLGALDSAFEFLNSMTRGILMRAEISFAGTFLVPCLFQRLLKVMTERGAINSCIPDN
jgi:hypothetical protein